MPASARVQLLILTDTRFLFIDQLQALHPLHVQPRPEREVPETYPTGV